MKYKIITNSSYNLSNETITVLNETTSSQSWLNHFEEAELVICITMSHSLTNNYTYAMEAKKIYEQQHPNRKVLVVDSYSCGPEIQLITQKLTELVHSNKTYIEVRNTIMDYRQKTRLFFVQCTKFGYVLGKANYDGNLITIKKCFSLKHLYNEIKSAGYQGGRFIVSHTENFNLAQKIKRYLNNDLIQITENDIFCSSLIKKGGILLGFEV